MKKFLLVVLALVMVLSLGLAGCNSYDNNNDVVKESPGTSDDSGKSGNGDYKVSEPGVLPIVDEIVELEIMMPYHPYVTDYEDNKFTKHLEEQTNVRVKFNLLPQDEATDKLNLLLNSGAKLPDAIMAMKLDNASTVMFGTQGLFIPLNDLIEKHGYNIKQLLDTYPTILPQITAPDGNIYALPHWDVCYNCNYGKRFWINKTFMDALGIDKVPETTDELYEYLKAVKNGDPNGNGKQDEIPLVGATTGWHQNIDGYLMNAFIYNDSDRYVITDESGIIDFAANKPEWRQGIEYLRKLCAEGLLDPMTFTLDKDGLRALVELEDAMIVGAVPSGGNHEFANATGERRKNYICIPPLKGPNGLRVAWWNKYAGVISGQFIITRDCKIPEIALKWADNCYTEENSNFDRYGEEGVDWIRPPEGTEAVNGGQAQYREILPWGTPQNSHWAGAAPKWKRFGSDAREKDLNDPHELEFVLFEAAKSYEQFSPQYVVPPLMFTPEEAREFTELKQTITDYVKEMFARFVTGDANIETEWDAYVEELNRIGVKRYLEIQQKAFERQWRDSWK